ncbi:MAG: hypothetical protein HYX86_05665 [Chloroflexi bacterium]|nr:hypothetical protein [Chloroflexota bacterium]
MNGLVVDLRPDRAYFRPKEEVSLTWLLRNQGKEELHLRLVAEIFYLSDQEGLLETTASVPAGGGTSVQLTWKPTRPVPAGYGVEGRVLDSAVRVVARCSTAFDVLEHWAQAPRYGFLCEFPPGRKDFEETMAWLALYHINSLQFYDWMYRHEDLLTSEDPYRDLLGRESSRRTVEGLVEAAHRRNIAALAYTSVYGSSPPFYQAHRSWGLFDANQEPLTLGDGFLYIMDPSPESAWTQHLMVQFAEALREIGFDGLHLDQYGEPRSGVAGSGKPVDLRLAFPAFINLAKTTGSGVRPDATVIFNAVNNWPIETVARANQDCIYIEVWPPNNRYRDLRKLIVNGQRASSGKPVVLAAYLNPARPQNVRLTDAVIFASGGYHMELGELSGMLADPYFPEYQRVSSDLAGVLRRYYDFAVRYENLLALAAQDNTEEVTDKISVEGVNTSPENDHDKVWVIARKGQNHQAISLINLLGIQAPEWNSFLSVDPTSLENFIVRYRPPQGVRQVWVASPDFPSPRASLLPLSWGSDLQGSQIEFTIPRLEYWDLVVVEFAK